VPFCITRLHRGEDRDFFFRVYYTPKTGFVNSEMHKNGKIFGKIAKYPAFNEIYAIIPNNYRRFQPRGDLT